ncbi:MAG: hypothetical protein Q4C42_11125 [Clostridia bacterium]|nr:hypothetical protein [Clostridia bacterium]
MENKELNTKKLSEEELDDVAGGGLFDAFGHMYESTAKEAVAWDDQHREIEWKVEYPYSTVTFHYECPHCKRYLHAGSWGYFYCDPCDDYFSPDDEYKKEKTTYKD